MKTHAAVAVRRLRSLCLVSVALLAALGAWTVATVHSATEAVRVRNAFLVEGEPLPAAAFSWTPDQPPSGFRTESRAAPALIRQGVDEALRGAPPSDWARALRLTEHLVRGAKDGGGIQAELGETYEQIVRNGRGYCADFTEVFLAMAHEAGIAARQWAFAFDGFGGYGHVLVEIFDRADRRWKMIDVFNNIYAVDAASGRVLNALEFRDFIVGQRQGVEIRKAGAGRLGMPVEAKLLEYYRRGADQWYMWWANDVVTYNALPDLAAARRFGNTAEKVAATVLGLHPTIRILRTATNADEVAALDGLRQRVVLIVVAGTVLGVAVLVTGVLWLRARRRAVA